MASSVPISTTTDNTSFETAIAQSQSDDLSTASKNSELILARIQKETNRLRKRRKGRRDSANSSNRSVRTGSLASASSEEYYSEEEEPELAEANATAAASSSRNNRQKGLAAVAIAERLSEQKTNSISLIGTSFDSALSTPSSPQTKRAAATEARHSPTWNEILDSSERSNLHLQKEEANITLKSAADSTNKSSATTSSHRTTNSLSHSKRILEEILDDNKNFASAELSLADSDPSEFSITLKGGNDSSGKSRTSNLNKNNNTKRFYSNTTTSNSNANSGNSSSALKFSGSNSSLNHYWSGITQNSSRKMADEAAQKKEDEAFRKKLIDEVLGKDAGDKVSMEKVMMIIWQFRDDKDVIKFMTRFVCKFAGSRDVFDGIEFYLPQLAHMMIHLETEWDDAILERFSLVIAQQSIHFALQLNWILAGAIEDYQPELPDGTPNPTYNPLYYFRCIKLLTNIERCVVYRRPRSQELQRLYEKGNITKSEMHNLEQADRRFTAMQIREADENGEIFGGNLKYKRAVRTSAFAFKRWKTRYFAIQERMLNCYNTEGGKLIRSMPLEGATVQAMKSKSSKYPFMFRVTNRSFEFRIRADSEEDRNKWIKMLMNEAKTGRVFGHTDGSLFMQNEDALRVIEELTPSQRDRYRFYRNEREFVRRLTDIAEDLRFQEPADRKKSAPGLVQELEIPANAYSPLMSSTDIFRRIDSSLSKDTRVFNTKARCPTVMYFLGVRGELEYKGERHANMDIAEYIHLKFDAKDWKNPEVKTEVSETGEGDEEIIEVALEEVVEVPYLEEEEAEERDSMITPEKGARSSSFVWSGSFAETPMQTPGDTPNPNKKPSSGSKHGSPARANRHLRKFLKESMVIVPRKLANHLEKKGTRHASNVRSNTGLSQSSESNVPIAIGRHSSINHGVGEDLWVGKSSVMSSSSKIIKGKVNTGDIDEAAMDRAKLVVCGGETWAEKSFRMLETVQDKPKDDNVQLEIVCLLSKSNDDLRQEVFVMQMIHYYKSVFIAAGIPLWLKTYKILSTSSSTGLLEFMVDSTSLDGLKKSEHYPKEGGLRKYFERTYGGPDSRSFKAAQRNFVQSLAAYSIVCYLLGLKDRHNGNIMIDMRGHLIHIDYGFCMGMCVGHEFTMERAPFKLTEEYVEVMGGTDGEAYKQFQRLFVEGIFEARSKCQIALGLVEIMMYQSNYPCFSGRRYGGGQALKGFRERLMLDVPDDKVEANARALIDTARNHWGTRAYDSFQQWSNGYAI